MGEKDIHIMPINRLSFGFIKGKLKQLLFVWFKIFEITSHKNHEAKN